MCKKLLLTFFRRPYVIPTASRIARAIPYVKFCRCKKRLSYALTTNIKFPCGAHRQLYWQNFTIIRASGCVSTHVKVTQTKPKISPPSEIIYGGLAKNETISWCGIATYVYTTTLFVRLDMTPAASKIALAISYVNGCRFKNDNVMPWIETLHFHVPPIDGCIQDKIHNHSARKAVLSRMTKSRKPTGQCHHLIE